MLRATPGAPERTAGSAIPQLGLLRGPQYDRPGAYGLAAMVAIAAVSAVAAATGWSGPHWPAFLPVCATLWIAADGLTAFFLLAQFSVERRRSRVVAAAAYLFSALLSIPYLVREPGAFAPGIVPGAVQSSAWLWTIWHAAFPAILVVAMHADRDPGRRIARRSVGRFRNRILATLALASALVFLLVIALRDRLPALATASGAATPWFFGLAGPVVVALNVAGLAYLARYAFVRRTSGVPRWLALATAGTLANVALEAASPARFSAGWYGGTLEAVLASSVLVAMFGIEIATLHRRLYDAASLDALTGLKNRRALEDDVRELAGSGSLAVLMVDVDHFKRYNDTYGHAAGDEALRVVAAQLRRVVRRPRDTVARYGGEEFLVLLPETTLPGARMVAERIRAAIAQLRVAHETSAYGYVTVSIGVGYEPYARPGATGAVVKLADRALYAAKAAGRDCIRILRA